MPLVRVTLHKGKNQDYLNAVSAAIYQSLVDEYEMPENDLFQIFEQVEPGSFFYDKTYPEPDRVFWGVPVLRLA